MDSSRELSPCVLSALLNRERIILTARLLRGVVHNLSSAIQMIALPLDLAQLAVEQGQTEGMSQRLASMHEGTDRLRMEVDLLAKRSLADQRAEAQPCPWPGWPGSSWIFGGGIFSASTRSTKNAV